MSPTDEKHTTTGYVGWSMHGLYVVGTVSFLAGAYEAVQAFNDQTDRSSAGFNRTCYCLALNVVLRACRRGGLGGSTPERYTDSIL